MRSGYVIFPQANVESEPSPLPDTERMQRELDLVDLAGELGFEATLPHAPRLRTVPGTPTPTAYLVKERY